MARSARPRSISLVPREEWRRRVLLLGIGALLLLNVGPVFGHHFASGLERTFAGRDHLGPVCLVALHEILQPVHFLFHLLIVAGLLYAVYDRVRAAQRMQRTLNSLDSRVPAPGGAFGVASLAAGVDPRRVRVVAGLPNPAFTAGWLRPRIYVAESLSVHLGKAELAAVLAHEGAHLTRRDPLRLSLLRFLACTLFWIPALRRLAADIADEAEIQADDHATREQPLALAVALLTLARWPTLRSARPDVVGIAERAGLLDRRIRRLAGEVPPVESHITRRSLVGALLALLVVWTSGAIMVHPLPVEAAAPHADHCEHPNESAASHLFCFPAALAAGTDACPHSRPG